MTRTRTLPSLLVALLLPAVAAAQALPVAPAPRLVGYRVTTPPPGYDATYTKYVSAGGFPVLGSEKVNDYALFEAAYLIDRMLAPRPDIRAAITESGCRFVVMAVTEYTTDVPEHRDLTPKDYWDRRARGLGATPRRPAVSCGEENLLCYPGDPYASENILVHEFGHAIHQMGLDRLGRDFDRRLKRAYDLAMADELWEGKYAATNRFEYWAEGVQSYFDTNRKPDNCHNHVRTREALAEYDPRLFELVDETFRQTPWRYVHPRDREELGHLNGYDPTAKRFRWPARLQTPPKK